MFLFLVAARDPPAGLGLPGLAARSTDRKRELAIAQWRKDSKKTDVIPVGSSALTPSTIEDVVIVGESNSSTSSNTSMLATTAEIVGSSASTPSTMEDVVIVGESSISTSSNTSRPATTAVHPKNLQRTLDGHVISTTQAFLQDKSHSAVSQAGQNSAKKRKQSTAAFAGSLCKAFQRQAVKQKIRAAEDMALQQRLGEHATLKSSDVQLAVWRAPHTDDTSIYAESLYAVLRVSEHASHTEIREAWRVLALDTLEQDGHREEQPQRVMKRLRTMKRWTPTLTCKCLRHAVLSLRARQTVRLHKPGILRSAVSVSEDLLNRQIQDYGLVSPERATKFVWCFFKKYGSKKLKGQDDNLRSSRVKMTSWRSKP